MTEQEMKAYADKIADLSHHAPVPAELLLETLQMVHKAGVVDGLAQALLCFPEPRPMVTQ